ncbi:hypothetical protein N7466_004089 [Penicillium verhagenii]|uniref:uncharacterized protein n=1 Tax=Penicillium verhagenii TaxID=1562060 RepID=UPI00254524EA|nr:uncharacterized protein N7466_004089 [Penicillium verhagenii]KAJ5934542.1 hypothetical protein N7466_004089 [Penicillium verhagenii]
MSPPTHGSPAEDGTEPNSSPEDLVQSIQEIFARSSSDILFSVGGKIDLTSATTQTTHEKRGPVTIRWDSGPEGSHLRKISFPHDEKKAAMSDSLEHLLKDCEPATFGRGSQEVLDEDYRQASKMDIDKFCSDYSPHDSRVMERIGQALAFSSDTKSSTRGLRAELYKLNVYSAPSGKFKAHVDTPRGEDQMGSLVVCLPTPHEGGELTIRRKGLQKVYSWGPLSTSHIQWAAFYSDDEHEVSEVTKGHRITLTYNLYWTSYNQTSMESFVIEDLQSPPWLAKLEELSKCKDYLKDGALGFCATQKYPHSASTAARGNIEERLKGLDMVVFQALNHLGGSTRVTTVVNDTDYQTQLREFREEMMLEDENQGPEDEKQGPEEEENGANKKQCKYYVGDGFHSPLLRDELADEEEYPSPGQFGGYSHMEVTWLNEKHQGNHELAMASIVTGNQPTMEAYYSTVAIIAEFK